MSIYIHLYKKDVNDAATEWRISQELCSAFPVDDPRTKKGNSFFEVSSEPQKPFSTVNPTVLLAPLFSFDGKGEGAASKRCPEYVLPSNMLVICPRFRSLGASLFFPLLEMSVRRLWLSKHVGKCRGTITREEVMLRVEHVRCTAMR